MNYVYQDCEVNDSNKITKKYTSLAFAVKNNQIDMVRILMSRSDININAIYSQYEYDYEKRTKNREDKTALILAIENQNVDLIKLLLSHKAIDLSIGYRKNKKKINKLLEVAEMTNNQEIIDILTNYKRK